MALLKARGVVLGGALLPLLLLLLRGPQPASALAPCTYCECQYNGGRLRLHKLDHEVDDAKCWDFCKKQGELIIEQESCGWDRYKRPHVPKGCTTICEGMDIPTGGCYPLSAAQGNLCPTLSTYQQCSNHSLGRFPGCGCALRTARQACTSCYQCKCTYNLGYLYVNVSKDPSNPIPATPENCPGVCKSHGKDQRATGPWGYCVPSRESGAGCHSIPCQGNCTFVSQDCTARKFCSREQGGTFCNCPLKRNGWEIAPGCPITNNPPVSPSVPWAPSEE